MAQNEQGKDGQAGRQWQIQEKKKEYMESDNEYEGDTGENKKKREQNVVWVTR